MPSRLLGSLLIVSCTSGLGTAIAGIELVPIQLSIATDPSVGPYFVGDTITFTISMPLVNPDGSLFSPAESPIDLAGSGGGSPQVPAWAFFNSAEIQVTGNVNVEVNNLAQFDGSPLGSIDLSDDSAPVATWSADDDLFGETSPFGGNLFELVVQPLGPGPITIDGGDDGFYNVLLVDSTISVPTPAPRGFLLTQTVAGPPVAIEINVEERSQVIPEPLALIVWSFLGLTVMGSGRRYRRFSAGSRR